jgi:hypothetical protein
MGLDLAMEGDLVTEEFQMAQIMMQIKLKKTFIIKIYQKKMMSQYFDISCLTALRKIVLS